MDVVLVDRDVLGEGPDAQIARARVDLVADGEVTDVRADLGHHSGDVVAEHEGLLVLQKLLELTVADHLVQWIDAGRNDSHQDVGVADLRLGYVGGAQAVLAVLRDDECLHGCPPARSSELGTSWSCLPNAATSRSRAGVTWVANRRIHGHAAGEFRGPFSQFATTTARGT